MWSGDNPVYAYQCYQRLYGKVSMHLCGCMCNVHNGRDEWYMKDDDLNPIPSLLNDEDEDWN